MLLQDKRFWDRVKKLPSGCWEWQGYINKGYGSLKRRELSNQVIKAHRYAFFLFNGFWPDICCHSCDNPPCVNPAHLFNGSHQDNSDDKLTKGRQRAANQKGENNGNAKLSIKQVNKIKKLITSGFCNTTIAENYGVTHQTISNIRRRKTWNND